MKIYSHLTLTVVFSVLISGCTSQDDKYFPEFSIQLPIIVSINNQPILIDGVYRSPEICRIDSARDANQAYEYLKGNFNSGWERVVFTSYAPSYRIEFGDIRISVLEGGLTIQVPRHNYLFGKTQNGNVTFVKLAPQTETYKLIRHICPNAALAGLYESPPVVQIEIRNTSDQSVSGVMVSGGGQTRTIASIEPLRTASVMLIPETDSRLELSFVGSPPDRVNCLIRTFLTPSMNGKVDIDITDDMTCEIRRDSTSLF